MSPPEVSHLNPPQIKYKRATTTANTKIKLTKLLIPVPSLRSQSGLKLVPPVLDPVGHNPSAANTAGAVNKSVEIAEDNAIAFFMSILTLKRFLLFVK